MAFLPYYAAFTDYTPTVPKFYWDVYSQEERIKKICEELHKLSSYDDTLAEKVNEVVSEIEQLYKDWDDFKEGAYADYYKKQIDAWIDENLKYIYNHTVKQVHFGLTDTGYFCAYIPDSWSDIRFDTGAVYGTEQYGRLILRYVTDGMGVIDNTAPDYGYAETVNDLRRQVDIALADSSDAKSDAESAKADAETASDTAAENAESIETLNATVYTNMNVEVN